MDITQSVYKCQHCSGHMKFYRGSLGISMASYVCEVCGTILIIPMSKSVNKIKIAGHEVVLDNKAAFNILKRELRQ